MTEFFAPSIIQPRRCACACNCFANIALDPKLVGLDTGGRCWACETAKREGRAPHGLRDHVYQQRDDDLAACDVCGGGEGSLPSECPGERMSEAQEAAVYSGKTDFKGGQWIDTPPRKEVPRAR